jgi:hypothetical protein
MIFAAAIANAAELYALVGMVVAFGFAAVGIGRVLPDPGHVTLGARLLMLPGAALLWPYIVARLIAGARP